MKDNIKRIMQIIGKLRTIISKWPMSPVWKPLIFLLLLLAIEIFLMVLSANACNKSWTYANRYVAGWFLINIVIILCATILTILRPKKGLIFTTYVNAFRAAVYCGYSILVSFSIFDDLQLFSWLISFFDGFNLDVTINLLAIYIALDTAISIVFPAPITKDANTIEANIRKININEANINSL